MNEKWKHFLTKYSLFDVIKKLLFKANESILFKYFNPLLTFFFI